MPNSWWKRGQAPGVPDPAAAAARQQQALDQVLRRSALMPDDLFRAVRLIVARCHALLDRAPGSHIGGDGVDVASRIAVDYLPTTVERYLQFDARMASTPITPGGQTPREVARGELRLLRERLDEIRRAVLKGDWDELQVHERFLQERFPGAGALVLPDPGLIPDP